MKANKYRRKLNEGTKDFISKTARSVGDKLGINKNRGYEVYYDGNLVGTVATDEVKDDRYIVDEFMKQASKAGMKNIKQELVNIKRIGFKDAMDRGQKDSLKTDGSYSSFKDLDSALENEDEYDHEKDLQEMLSLAGCKLIESSNKLIWLQSSSGDIEIQAPRNLVNDVASSGDNSFAVSELKKVPSVKNQLKKLNSDVLKNYISEQGVEEVERMNRDALEDYALWLLSWDFSDREFSDNDLDEASCKMKPKKASRKKSPISEG